MKKVLITGGHGFIGQALAYYLSKHDYEITTVDFKKLNSQVSKNWIPIVKDVREYFKQLDDMHKLRNLFGEDTPFDLIIHLAAIPRSGIASEYPEAVLRNDIDCLVSALGYCRTHTSTRFIYASSSAAVWADSRYNTAALVKQIGEQIVSTYSSSYGIKATTARLFNVYGPGESEYGENTGIIRSFKKAVWLGTPVVIYGSGDQTRDFTHIDDVVDGLSLIVNEMLTDDFREIYEIGTATADITVSQIANEFIKGTGLTVAITDRKNNELQFTKADSTLWPKFWYPKHDILSYINRWKDEGCPLD